jgi:hypothetical protein
VAETILIKTESENDIHSDPHFRPRRISASIGMMITNTPIARSGPMVFTTGLEKLAISAAMAIVCI